MRTGTAWQAIWSPLSLITKRRLMRAKTDAGTDVGMTEVADAAPSFWVHCRYCVFQLFVMNAFWEFKSIPQLCWWTCLDIINSFRETAFKRSLDQAMKHDTAFLHRKRGTDASRWMFKMMRVWKLCTIFLETPPPSFATLQLLFC